MSDWLPINTAPKDGPLISLAGMRWQLKSPRSPDVEREIRVFFNCYWDKTTQDPPIWVASEHVDHWNYPGRLYLVGNVYEVTHWMPQAGPPLL